MKKDIYKYSYTVKPDEELITADTLDYLASVLSEACQEVETINRDTRGRIAYNLAREFIGAYEALNKKGEG